MTSNQTVLISGASGLIGSALTDALRSRGSEVRRLVRREARYADEFEWDPYEKHIDDRAFNNVDVVVNLSGASLGDGRWSDAGKRILIDSRIETTRFLADQIVSAASPPTAFISASAIGYYGDRGDEVLTEASSRGPEGDFLASLVAEWEKAADAAREAGVRTVHPRTGLVLGPGADLLDRLTPLFKFGLGGPLGSGRQWWSWVDIDDVVGSIIHLMEGDHTGSFNITAPEPVKQAEFARTFGEILSRPSFLPAPSFGMKLVLGSEKAEALGLSSTRAIPARLTEMNYEFRQPDLERSLRKALAN